LKLTLINKIYDDFIVGRWRSLEMDRNRLQGGEFTFSVVTNNEIMLDYLI